MVQISCHADNSAGSSVQEEGFSETTRRHVPDGRNSELHSCWFTEEKLGNNVVSIRGKRETSNLLELNNGEFLKNEFAPWSSKLN